MHIFWIGFPGLSGGANTECWHTAKMLRRNGVEITFLPTVKANSLDDLPELPRKRLESIGCKIRLVKEEHLADVPGLKGSVVVSMCNEFFIRQSHHFRQLGCPVVWVNCMTFLFPSEVQHYRQFGTYDAYVMQSDWQRQRIEPALQKYGHDRKGTWMIRGAFDLEEFPYKPKPHKPEDPFVIGRLARHDADKWSSMLWDYCGAIKKKLPCPLKARLMAWAKPLEKKCGKVPDYAETLESCQEASDAFLQSLHAVVAWNGGAGENWPRTGLEAMATGVPLVVQNKWGWREMIRHNDTGFLCEDKPGDVADIVRELAINEDYRLSICESARKQAERFASDEEVWPKWREMLETLERKGRAAA